MDARAWRGPASAIALLLGTGLATCCPRGQIGSPGGGSAAFEGSARPSEPPDAPAPGVAAIEGPALGLFSETHPWADATDATPMMLLYFQHGTDAGLHVYSGLDYAPSGANVWFDKARLGDAVEGDVALWYRRPPLGADSPTRDAHNASTRLVWRTFGAPHDVGEYRYVNVWVKALDGYDGHLGISLASWDPATGGSSGDDGAVVSRLFPQRIAGEDWHGLSIPLSEFHGFDPTYFAKYVLEFPTQADGHAFLLDNITFSVNPPRAAGAPDPELYALTEPGEDPTEASDRVVVSFDRSRTHQTIRGFGTTGDSASKARLVTDLGASLVRVRIPVADPEGGSVATRANTWGWEPVNDDDDDMSFVESLGGFDHADVAELVSVMRSYRELDPNIDFFACAFSPPGWMKNGGRVAGGSVLGDEGNSLRDDAFGEYGEYLAAFALYLHQQGLPLAGLSMGNEVHFNHDFPSMYVVGDDMLRVIRETQRRLDHAEQRVPDFSAPLLTTDDHVLGRYFFESGFVPLIEGIRDDVVARSAVDVVSYHSYGVDAQTPENVPETVLSRLRAKVDADLGADTELWMTETSGFNNGLLDSGERRGALRMAEGLHTSLVYADVTAWVHLGGGELLHFGRLSWPGHILRHYARFVRPGAVRFDAAPARLSDRVLISAFENPASSDQGPSIAVVLINTDDAPRGLDLSALPDLPGYTTYREYRSSVHHAGEDMGELTPSDTAARPYVLPPHGVVTLYQGPAIPTL